MNSKIKFDIFYTAVSYLFVTVIYFAIYKFYAKTVEEEQLSVFFIFNLFLSYAVFTDGGVGRLIVYFSNGDQAKYSLTSIVKVAVFILSFLSTFYLFIFYFYCFFFDPDFRLVFLANFFIVLASIIIVSLLEAHGDYLLLALFRVLFVFLPFLLFYFKAFILGSQSDIYFDYFHSRIVFLFFCCMVILYLYRKRFFPVDNENNTSLTFLTAWKYSSNVFYSNLIAPFLSQADKVLVSLFFPSTMSLAYLAANDIIAKLSVIPTSINRVYFRVYLNSSKNIIIGTFFSNLKMFFFILVPLLIFVMVFYDYLILYWLGRAVGFIDYFSIFILGIAFFISACAQVAISILFSHFPSRTIVRLYAWQLPLYIFLLFFMWRYFEFYGVAVAFLLRSIIDAISVATILKSKL